MPFKPFVVLSTPVALGATLLGVSASLLALDVTGTVFLDRIRTTDAAARANVAAATPIAASLTSAVTSVVSAPRAAPPSPHVYAPHPSAAPHARPQANPVVAMQARQASVVTVARKMGSRHAPVIVARTSRASHPAATEPAVGARPRPFAARRVVIALQAPAPPTRSELPIASLRDVRHFVMRKLRARDHRVCAISATAYTARDGYVVVDLVMRDRHARWSEKAVVRRNGTDLKLIGATARALPYRTVASSGVIPHR